MVQWLGLSAFTAEGWGSIPGRGTKIPEAGHCDTPPPPHQKADEINIYLPKLSVLLDLLITVKIVFNF